MCNVLLYDFLGGYMVSSVVIDLLGAYMASSVVIWVSTVVLMVSGRYMNLLCAYIGNSNS
jgi:hypothetical protein